MENKLQGMKADIMFKDESVDIFARHHQRLHNSPISFIDFPAPNFSSFDGPTSHGPQHGWYRKFENNDKRPEVGCTKKRRKK